MSNFKENLRPCVFTLEGCDTLGYARQGLREYNNDEQRENATRQRTGLFHTWGTELRPQTEDGKILSCGVVEDTADGKIYRVNPENIQFTDNY